MTGTSEQELLSTLLVDGWKVVGFSIDRQPSSKPNEDWNSQIVLIQKDGRLRSYEFLYDGKSLYTVTERDLTLGVSY